jgi:hypothetical protein
MVSAISDSPTASRCPTCGTVRIGGPGDTIDDRHDNSPALRFEGGPGGVWLVKATGGRYLFSAGPAALPGWLDYYRRMAGALDVFLHQPEVGFEPEPVPEPETHHGSTVETEQSPTDKPSDYDEPF